MTKKTRAESISQALSQIAFAGLCGGPCVVEAGFFSAFVQASDRRMRDLTEGGYLKNAISHDPLFYP